ncbi:hypothetical protein ABBQ32_013214 [Trebouxia sp. C0010 RCD-2024]
MGVRLCFSRHCHTHTGRLPALHKLGLTQQGARAKYGVDCRTSQGQDLRLRSHSHPGQQAHVQQEGRDISKLNSALQQQWDHKANAHLGNIIIKLNCPRKVWWTCPDGHLHTWSAVVQNRTRGSGCPQCSSRQVCKHNSLATKAPLVAAQWDYQASDCTPDDVMAQSNHMANWHCKVCGCKWEATPNARVSKRKAGCPQCANDAKTKKLTHPSFAECNHPLLAERDHKRNAAQGHFPDRVRLHSTKQIFWLCSKCPAGQEHSWSAVPHNRTGRSKTGCPLCAGQAACACNSLQALCPAVAAEWDYSKNQGLPCDYTASSTFLASWSSPQRGSWQQTITSRTVQVQKAARLKRAQERHLSADPVCVYAAGLKPGPTEV